MQYPHNHIIFTTVPTLLTPMVPCFLPQSFLIVTMLRQVCLSPIRCSLLMEGGRCMFVLHQVTSTAHTHWTLVAVEATTWCTREVLVLTIEGASFQRGSHRVTLYPHIQSEAVNMTRGSVSWRDGGMSSMCNKSWSQKKHWFLKQLC